MDNIKINLREIVCEGFELLRTGFNSRFVCKHGNEPPGFMKSGFIEQMSNDLINTHLFNNIAFHTFCSVISTKVSETV
jgi:hypothetical protein